MSKKVIYSGFSDERRFIIDYLFKKHNWNPGLFLYPERMRKWAEEHYPDAVFVDAMGLRQANFDYSRIGPFVPADAKIISVLSKYEFSCFDLRTPRIWPEVGL